MKRLDFKEGEDVLYVDGERRGPMTIATLCALESGRRTIRRK